MVASIKKGTSCRRCRIHKMKCDRNLPCSACTRANTGDECRKNPPGRFISDRRLSAMSCTDSPSFKAQNIDWSLLQTDQDFADQTMVDALSNNSFHSLYYSEKNDTCGAVWTLHLVRLLPSKYQCDTLINEFFDSYQYLYNAVHEPSFYTQYHQLWTTPTSEVDLLDIGLVFAMLCTTSHEASVGLSERLDVEPTYLRDMSKIWFNCCLQAMYAYDIDKNPSMKQITIFLVLQSYLFATKNVQLLNSYLSKSIAAAQLLDIHQQTICKGFIETEMRKRLWWDLCAADTYQSLCLTRPPLISCANSTSPLPTYCNDYDITENSVTARPLTEPLRMASNYYMIRFMKIWNRLWTSSGEYINTPENVQQIDKEIEQLVGALPWFFTFTKEGQLPYIPKGIRSDIYWQFHFLWSCIYTQRFRMHRSFLSPRIDYSFEACLDAASKVLQVYVQLRPQISTSNGKFLQNGYQLFSAATAQAIFILIERPRSAPQIKETIELVISDLQIMHEKQKLTTPVIIDGLRILRMLLEFYDLGRHKTKGQLLPKPSKLIGDDIYFVFGGHQKVQDYLDQRRDENNVQNQDDMMPMDDEECMEWIDLDNLWGKWNWNEWEAIFQDSWRGNK
ncbi:unnamed protein product [Kuraishia capsulata CBS 1993]|uniref:Zn(2)-C6 fungal-type domain-containing protein n=1 Tax=Kuraishia capsulata CBS 1993 TaxID=1382522 RepID=W6MJ34_9ASCO|nr:uncharacterized protein KUCA_T00002202001 [Kuraishia capsulata CBS 1993]CDK26231.1 unnamed protein product [Kuraishia capsulata CBS 1993]